MAERLKIVALEEHLVTPEIKGAWADLDALNQDDAVAYYYQGKIDERLLDLTDERLRQMDDTGVDVQVLSLTTPGVQSLEPVRAVALSRQSNDLIAQTVSAHPARFQGFAALPTQDPQAAADELRRAVGELGLRGAMMFGRTRERNLDHPDNEPIFAAANTLRAPLYLHSQIPPRPVREAYYSGLPGNLDIVVATVGVGWHYEAGLQFLRLVLAGVFDRYPDLRIILGHWGDMMVFYLEELDKIPKLAGSNHRPVSEYFKRHAYVTPSGVLSQRYLAWAIEVMGVDHVLFSLDYPFAPRSQGDVRAFLAQALSNDTDREKIASGNWEALAGQIRADW